MVVSPGVARSPRVVDPLGMKLLVDIALEPDRPHALDVAGTRTVADTVEDVRDRRVGQWGRAAAPPIAETAKPVQVTSSRRIT